MSGNMGVWNVDAVSLRSLPMKMQFCTMWAFAIGAKTTAMIFNANDWKVVIWMTDLKDQYKQSLKVFRIMIKWFDTLKSQADRDYILQLLNEKKDVIPF